MISKISLMLLMMTMSFGVMAQSYNTDAQTGVLKGSTYKYRVPLTSGNTYTWTITEGVTNVTSDNAIVSVAVTNGASYSTIEIKWLKAGTYKVNLEEATSHDCKKTQNAFDVIVIEPTAVNFNVTVPAAACANVMNSFVVKVKLEGVTYPYTIEWEMEDDNSDKHVGTLSIDNANETDLAITGFDVSEGSGEVVKQFVITKLIDNHGFEPNVTKSYDVTIYQNPANITIQHN